MTLLGKHEKCTRDHFYKEFGVEQCLIEDFLYYVVLIIFEEKKKKDFGRLSHSKN